MKKNRRTGRRHQRLRLRDPRQKKGFDVLLSDAGRIADRYRAKLDEWQVPYEEGGHSEELILAASEVVKSPGIPDSAPIVRKIRERGIPVVSEIEFAGRYIGRAKCICVTGSNGKTTTTSLIYRIMRDAGMNVALGGNIGESFAYLRSHGRLRLVRAGVELVPARRHVCVPRPHRRADQHHARPPRPLRPLLPELRRREDADRPQHDLARLVRLLGRRRDDRRRASEVRPRHAPAPLHGPQRRGERRRRRLPARRQVHRDGGQGLGRDRHGEDAHRGPAQRLQRDGRGPRDPRRGRRSRTGPPLDLRLRPRGAPPRTRRRTGRRAVDQRLEGHQRRLGVVCAREHDAPHGVDRRRHRQGQRLRPAAGVRPREGPHAGLHGPRQRKNSCANLRASSPR